MRSLPEFENRLPPELRRQFQALRSPAEIQAYLDSLPYIAEELDRSPLRAEALLCLLPEQGGGL